MPEPNPAKTDDPPTSQQTTYDQIPYKSQPFRQSHPDRLATIARLFGRESASPAGCRVLELGCASGGNLVPMAEQFPESRFLGIDASARQIDEGRTLINELGLSNIELRHEDILDFRPEKDSFDYIICHGVYSWVQDEVRRAILKIIQQGLAAGGIGYVSYNTYPGWHMRGMIRDIMRFRAKSFETPEAQLAQARGLLAFLANSVRTDDDPYGMLLKREILSIDRADDSYLLHEHLEEINEPLYFHQFAERLAAAGLQYLGEAEFGVMSLDNFPEQVAGMLRSVSRDVVEIEQYMDFLRNRSFRQTLVCREGEQLDRSADHRRLLGLRVASSARLEGNIRLEGREETVFRRGPSSLTTTDPVVKAAFLRLHEAWPASIPFLELVEMARSQAAGPPAAVGADVMSGAAARLAETLLRCLATTMIDLHAAAPSFVTHVSERPTASPLARRQARFGAMVTNRLHISIDLDEMQRQILPGLDGSRDEAAIIDDLAGRVGRGELVMHYDGRAVDTEDGRRILGHQVPQVLASLARSALLIG